MKILSDLTATIMCDLVNPTKYLLSSIKAKIGAYNDIEYGQPTSSASWVNQLPDDHQSETLVRPDFPTQEGNGICVEAHYDFWRYHKIESSLGEGTFGRVYSIKKMSTNTNSNSNSSNVTVFKWVSHAEVTAQDINREVNILRNVPDSIDFLPKYLSAGIYEHNAIKHYGIQMNRVIGSDLDKFMQVNFHFMNNKYDLVVQMINIVYYLHVKLGIVHRDLKIRNFMYNVLEHKLTLIDFGMAECYDETHPYYDEKLTTGNKMKIGTALYMPLEMFRTQDKITPKDFPSIDIWALGITFYFLYYGIEPFGQDLDCSLPELIKEIETYYINPNSLILSNITHDKVLTLVKNCLRPNRNERWTISQLMDFVYQ